MLCCCRLSKYTSSHSGAKLYSRKEKALKIYTDDSPVKPPPPYSAVDGVSASSSSSSHGGGGSGNFDVTNVSQPDID